MQMADGKGRLFEDDQQSVVTIRAAGSCVWI